MGCSVAPSDDGLKQISRATWASKVLRLACLHACTLTSLPVRACAYFIQRGLEHPTFPPPLQPIVEAVGPLNESMGIIPMQKIIFMGSAQE